MLFLDKETKYKETGHQGMGWAYGNTMVEVYSADAKCDPYHETCHALTHDFGAPPAIFNEGMAVYMSQKLGAKPLVNMRGSDLTVHERTRQIKTSGDWIPLEKLLTFTEIGSEESRPEIAYAEAGSFVQFLVDQYGREKFLEAYRETWPAGEGDALEENRKALQRVYQHSLTELEAQWLQAIGAGK